jgi:hypothetical protein
VTERRQVVTVKNNAEALVIEAPAMEKVTLPCTMGDACEYVTPELGVEYAMQLLDKHLLGVHEQGPAETGGPAAAPPGEDRENYQAAVRIKRLLCGGGEICLL